MYKMLLCVRYLRTRYLAGICIVSMMLGVSTLIVVNSVMSGFSNKLKDRLHGVLSDIIVGTERLSGFPDDPDEMMRRIQKSPAGKHVVAMAPTVEVVGTFHFTCKGHPVVKPVKIIGIDPERQSEVGQFKEYLVRQKNAAKPTFDLTESAFRRFQENLLFADQVRPERVKGDGWKLQGPDLTPAEALAPIPPMPGPLLAPAAPARLKGIIIGYSLAHYRYPNKDTGLTEEVEVLKEGDSVFMATLGANGADPTEMKPVYGTFIVADYFKSEMSEYDSQFVYMPIDELQKLRGMDSRATNLQIKLKDDVRNSFTTMKHDIAPEIQKLFNPYEAQVLTWQEHQGPLLAAIDIERGILNLLLFMIVGVAGFSILAIFTMIVSEKYRDIGILKSLGASSSGVLGIFIWYAILLGVVGCTCGTLLGLGITTYINEIETFLTKLTGQQLFDRSVYYFDKIPTQVEPMTVVLVNVGAMTIAVFSSLIPALRAARLQPIRALRFE